MTFAWQLPLAASGLGTLIFILFFLIVGVVQMFRNKGTAVEGDEEESSSPSRRSPSAPPSQQRPPPRQYTAEQEEVRKFLEALGKPRSAPPPPPRATPPPVLRPVPQAQRPRPLPVAQPARKPVVAVTIEGDSEEDRDESPVNVITGEKTRHEFTPIERVDLAKEMQAVETAVGGALHAQAPAVVTAGPTNRAAEFRKLLSEKASVRQAVILAEVIGRPKWQ